MNRFKKIRSNGFTIVELMIATTVFSVVLLLAAFAFLQIGRSYSKGTTESQTQAAARAIIDDVSQAIQFSGGAITLPATKTVASTSVNYFCVGEKRYIYVLNQQLNNPADHGFLWDKEGSNCNSNNEGSWPAMSEMLGPRMRLAHFSMSAISGNLWNIKVRIAYGDTDLFVDKVNNSTGLAPADGVPDVPIKCNQDRGAQFCAVSELTTTVQSRI